MRGGPPLGIMTRLGGLDRARANAIEGVRALGKIEILILKTKLASALPRYDCAEGLLGE